MLGPSTGFCNTHGLSVDLTINHYSQIYLLSTKVFKRLMVIIITGF